MLVLLAVWCVLFVVCCVARRLLFCVDVCVGDCLLIVVCCLVLRVICCSLCVVRCVLFVVCCVLCVGW